MDIDYYADMYAEQQAEYDIFYKENMKLSDAELINNCVQLKEDIPEEVPNIVSGIIHYHSVWGEISQKQRDVLIDFLTDMDVAWN